MNFNYKDNFLNNNDIELHTVEKCHLSVSFNPKEVLDSSNDDLYNILDFYEDESVEKPRFIKGVELERTIESRWVTPCSVKHNTSFLNGMHFTAYYHPQIYILAKNVEFRNFIIEHALRSLCSNNNELLKPKYSILSFMAKAITIQPVKPHYELCLFSSRLCPRQYFQLNVWLPNIISANSIILECSISNVLVQTERPFNYELNIKWPNHVIGHRIMFSAFIKKERRLTLVSEKLNFIEESEQETMITDDTSPTLDSDTLPFTECTDEDMPHSCLTDDPIVDNNITVVHGTKKKKNLKVTFSTVETCLVFQESESVVDIKERDTISNVTKTKDGCSTKRYTYQMNKRSKRERTAQPCKGNNKNKRNGRKKK